MTLYFVVRTDVSAESGSQRVFGAYDTRKEASDCISHLRTTVVGKFAVYEGKPA